LCEKQLIQIGRRLDARGEQRIGLGLLEGAQADHARPDRQLEVGG